MFVLFSVIYVMKVVVLEMRKQFRRENEEIYNTSSLGRRSQRVICDKPLSYQQCELLL